MPSGNYAGVGGKGGAGTNTAGSNGGNHDVGGGGGGGVGRVRINGTSTLSGTLSPAATTGSLPARPLTP